MEFIVGILLFLALIFSLIWMLVETNDPEWFQRTIGSPAFKPVFKAISAFIVLLIIGTSLLMLKFITDHLFYGPGRILPRVFYPESAHSTNTFWQDDFVIGEETMSRATKRLNGDKVDRFIDDIHTGEGNVPLLAATELKNHNDDPRVIEALFLMSHSTYTAYRNVAETVLYEKTVRGIVFDRLERIALQGRKPDLLYLLGKSYCDSDDNPRGIPFILQALELVSDTSRNSYERSADWVRTAQYKLAMMYAKGAAGVPKNSNEALRWFIQVAEHGDRDDQYEIGIIYSEGKYGVRPNPAEAVRWLEQAASNYHDKAPDRLAEILYAQKDYKRALPWIEQRVKKKDKEFQYRLAMMYMNGNGVEQDYGTAEDLLWNAIFHRKAPAQLLKIYRSGHGKKRDTGKVIKDLELLIVSNRNLSRMGAL